VGDLAAKIFLLRCQHRRWMGLRYAWGSGRSRFLEFCRYLGSLYVRGVRIAIICDNFSPHLTTKKDKVSGRCAANNTEIAYTPTNSS
jgi:hypothetical protein